MFNLANDQAAGLRRLFAGARGPTTIAFAGSPGVGGRGVLAAGLACGLAAAGKEVLIIDENSGTENVATAFGMRSRFDLMQAVNHDVPMAQVVLHPEASVRLIPAARAVRQCARLAATERLALSECLRRLQKGADFVLADTAGRTEGGISPLLPQPHHVVVALGPGSQSITGAYAQMKRLSQSQGCRRFGVVILGAAPAEGGIVFTNLQGVARRHLGAEIDLLGCLSARPGPGEACHALAESFLGKPRQSADSGFAFLGRRLQGPAAPAAALVPASGSGV